MRFAFVILLAACGANGDVDRTPRHEEPLAPTEPVESPPPAPTVETGVRGWLGDHLATVEHASSVEVAPLRVIAAAESESATLTAPDRILGYPAARPLRAITPAQIAVVRDIVLDPESYTEVMRRCANHDFYGARFTLEGDTVEIALGMDCEQMLIAYRSAAGVARWGSVMESAPAARLRALIEAAGMTSADALARFRSRASAADVREQRRLAARTDDASRDRALELVLGALNAEELFEIGITAIDQGSGVMWSVAWGPQSASGAVDAALGEITAVSSFDLERGGWYVAPDRFFAARRALEGVAGVEVVEPRLTLP